MLAMTRKNLRKAIKLAGNASALSVRLGITRSYMTQLSNHTFDKGKARRPWPKDKEEAIISFIANE
jgi:hypothetical protein